MLELGGVTQALQTPNASDNAASVIRAMIHSGQLRPGDKLPSGAELAKQLGISVVTLRLALKSLESTGYIVVSLGAHGGARVSGVEGLSSCWARWMLENADQIEDVFELRFAIEMRIAALAAAKRTSDELEAIDKANELLAGPNPDIVPWNVAFHHAVAQAAHSPHLLEAWLRARQLLFLPVDVVTYGRPIDDLRAAHAAILDAVRAQAPGEASEAMRAHLADTLSAMLRSLEVLREQRRRQGG